MRPIFFVYSNGASWHDESDGDDQRLLCYCLLLPKNVQCPIVPKGMPPSASREEITQILLSAGNGAVPSELVALVYDELRAIARSYLHKERAGHTLQATALVHEAYVRLVDQTRISWKNRAHFLGMAARVMRRILVDHARAHRAEKRGGAQEATTLNEETDLPQTSDADLLALDAALRDLAVFDARQSRIVELRFFGGLTTEEIGQVLDLSPRTIKREWRLAKAWLHREIVGGIGNVAAA
jgi:RNA polymerase sigma-70 factor, ECF subfamily